MVVVTFVRVKVPLVAPARLDHELPLLVETCHWYVGVGLPLAVALKYAVCPDVTVWLAGCVVK